MPQRDRLPGIKLHAFFRKTPSDVMGQSQIHVVAAYQQVIADGNSPQHQFTMFLGSTHEGQVRRTAAHIAYQQRVAHGQRAPPTFTRSSQPCINRCLRFFNQHQIRRQSGVERSLARQLASAGVERCRHGQHNMLLGQRSLRMGRMPSRRQMLKIALRRRDR